MLRSNRAITHRPAVDHLHIQLPLSVHKLANRTNGAIGWLLLLPVHAYRKVISPMLGPRCRYYPSCSHYAVDAVKTYGPIRGSVLASWRVVRCNPLSDGGFDYVEDQKLFRSVRDDRHKHGDCGHGHGASS